jgi:hypothetical protein
MKRGMIGALMALGLAGCGPTVWEKAGATTQDFNVDSYGCERDARRGGGYAGSGIFGNSFFDRCMIAHGWSERKSASYPPRASTANDPSAGPMGSCQIAGGIKIAERKSTCEARGNATWSAQAD